MKLNDLRYQAIKYYREVSVKVILAILVFLSQIEIGYSQCNIPGNSNPVEAFIFCDLDMLNQLKCTTNPNEDNAGLHFLCPQGGKVENAWWWRFIPHQNNIDFTLNVSHCSSGQGIQFAIYEGDQAKEAFYCRTICLSEGSHNIQITGLYPCKTYYLAVDGCNADYCRFDLIAKDIHKPIYPDSFEIVSSHQSDTLCQGEEVIFSYITNYESCHLNQKWNIQNKLISKTSKVNFSLKDTGVINVCLDVWSGEESQTEACFYKQICKKYFVRSQQRTVLNDTAICFENLPFVWFGDTINTSGTRLYSKSISDSNQYCTTLYQQRIEIFKSPDTISLYNLLCSNKTNSDTINYRVIQDIHHCNQIEKTEPLFLHDEIADAIGDTIYSCSHDFIFVEPIFSSELDTFLPQLKINWDEGNQNTLNPVFKFGKSRWIRYEVIYNSTCNFVDSVFLKTDGKYYKPEIFGVNKICPDQSYLIETGKTYKNYKWSTGDTSSYTIITQGGNYCVEVTDQLGCIGSNCWFVAEYPKPVAGIKGANSFCSGDSIQLESSQIANSYFWNTQDTSARIFVQKPGEYCLTVRTLAGCADTECITINEKESYKIDRSDFLCSGDSFFIANFFLTDSGLYDFKLTTKSGCDSVIRLHLRIPPEIKLDSTGILPQPDNRFLIHPYFSGGIGSLQFKWETGETTNSITVAQEGSYSIEVYDSIGCIKKFTILAKNTGSNDSPIPIFLKQNQCLNSVEFKNFLLRLDEDKIPVYAKLTLSTGQYREIVGLSALIRDTERLTPGLYYVTLINSSNEISTIRLLIANR